MKIHILHTNVNWNTNTVIDTSYWSIEPNGENAMLTTTITTTAWTDYTNANLFIDKKKNRKLANIPPSSHFYGMIFW